MAAFMTPEYTDEPMALVDTNYGTEVVPGELFHPDRPTEYTEGDVCESFEIVSGQWFYRLSASGYMDCTPWSGPFPTLRAARKELSSQEDVCPFCGDDTSEKRCPCRLGRRLK